MVDHHFAWPVDSEIHKANLPHHGMTCLIPKLSRNVLVIFPGFVGSFREDTRHHLWGVDLPEPLVKHHQRLGLGLECVVVKERLCVDSHVVRVWETLITPWDAM